MDLFPNRKEEFEVKLERIRKLMREKEIQNLLITEAHHFSWLTCGGENFVFLARSGGAAPLMVTQEKVYLAADNIEAMRLFPEEIEGLPINDGHHLWYLTPDEIETHYQTLNPGIIVKDIEIENDLKQLHAPLCKDEIERYRWLGKVAEESIRNACIRAERGMSEYEIGALLAKECFDREIWPVLILVAGDERALNYRHPLPTNNPVNKQFMLVLCARRYGLIANVSRIVSFEPIDEIMRKKHKAVCSIDATLNLSSVPGVSYGDVLKKGIAQYDEHGYEHEWQLHHQGGPTGYLGRYFKAIPTTQDTVQNNQAVAWNPSISGTKCEDTVLITQQGLEVLTKPIDWPVVKVEIDGRILNRSDILIRE